MKYFYHSVIIEASKAKLSSKKDFTAASTMPDPKTFGYKIEPHGRGPKDDLIESTNRAIGRFAGARAKTIQTLREVADECDDIARVQKGLEVAGGAVSVVGNVAFNYI